MKLAERNKMALGKAASNVQLAELAIFGLKVGVSYRRPIIGAEGKVKGNGDRADLRRYRDDECDHRADFGPKGGLTFVTLHKTGRGSFPSSTVGVARCRNDERFNSQMGREIALKRAMRRLPGREPEPSPLPEEEMRHAPLTPPEALLMIRRLIASLSETRRTSVDDLIDDYAAKALDRLKFFKLTRDGFYDRLIESLATAHHQLRIARTYLPRHMLEEYDRVRVLDPDLELIVELRLDRRE